MESNPDFQGGRYRDDRIFVLHLSRCTIEAGADDTITTTIYHESPPSHAGWCVVTYRNTQRYPAFRVDPFAGHAEALQYLHTVEPQVPLVSLGGRSPSHPMQYDEFAAWKIKNGMKLAQ